MEAAGLAAYCWTIADDQIAWSANAENVLGVAAEAIRSGRSFSALLDPESPGNRYDAVMAGGSDTGTGVAFQIECLLRPEGRGTARSLWLEDSGRWFAGPDGRPARVLGTVRRIDERQIRQQELRRRSHHDPLTGMLNRSGLTEALDRALAETMVEPSSCALLIAAIGNLSDINEVYGFEVADEVVAEAGRRLAATVRAGDAVARYSGSKFGLILRGCGEEELAAAADRFLARMSNGVVETQAGPVWALLSAGAVVLPRHAADPPTAIARAEEALAQARQQPFDGFAIYSPSPQDLSDRLSNAHCASIVVSALKEHRLGIAFQPVIDARSREPRFHEALLRLEDDGGRSIPANQLVPVAEKLGLVRLVDRAVVELAVAALHRHRDARISVNISGTTATDPRWWPEVTAILAENREVASRLMVEITETVALGDLSATTRFVRQLKALGVTVAIDDFGAGYTSFRNLRAMPVDMLKIDGSFCRDLASHPDNRYFVRALIDLARAFGLTTVAEWVETEADAALLADWGIDMMQGKLFGEAETLPPVTDIAPPEAAETLAQFSADLEGELAKLREALSQLDEAFQAPRHGTG
jgi:diguanylate cyclase (GGDEF)-like protein